MHAKSEFKCQQNVALNVRRLWFTESLSGTFEMKAEIHLKPLN